MNRTVVITGYGLLTPFGWGEKAVTDHLFRGNHAFGPITRFDTGKYRCAVAAESGFSGSLMELGMICTEQSLRMAGLSSPVDAAVIIGTPGDYNLVNEFTRNGGSLARNMKESVPVFHAKAIAESYTTNSRAFAFNNACIAASNAIGYAFDLIQYGKEHTVICGGYYLNNEEMFAKFDSAQSLSKDGKVRSFSSGRTGLLLGDGGCIFILEDGERAKARNAPILAEIAGWGSASDAYHIVQPHPDGNGMASAMRRALSRSGLRTTDIRYINAHGTGTIMNDAAETNGIKNVFGEHAYSIPISSTKSMTGHILHGTGAVETAICMIAMKYNFVPPTAHFELEDEICDLNYVPNQGISAELSFVMNLNSSFGGNNTAILLKKCGED